MPSAIVPFAQKEMVQTFMNGIDPDLSGNIFESYFRTLVQSCLDVLEKYGENDNKTDGVRKKITEAAMEGIRKLAKDTAEHSKRKFSRPIVEILSLLPKDELPALAEALVSLTSI